MSKKSLTDIAEAMKGIDIAMLSTRTDGGHIATRPMSNNNDVAYDGTSYYFADGNARVVSDIGADDQVALGFSGKPGLLSSTAYVAVAGKAELVRDKASFKDHWNSDLDAWFEKGVDTPGLVMIKVVAERIKYWDKQDQTELVL